MATLNPLQDLMVISVGHDNDVLPFKKSRSLRGNLQSTSGFTY